jgi:hypothetical protein
MAMFSPKKNKKLIFVQGEQFCTAREIAQAREADHT